MSTRRTPLREGIETSHFSPDSLWLPGAGIRVHALDWGPADAPALVLLLHGVAGNASIWNAAAGSLRDRLGDAARVVALDGRDGGLTEHPTSGYALEDFGADLASVHDALGSLPLTLVGHSRGGWFAAWFAARHPERVTRLVLVDPARLAFESDTASDRFFERVRAGLGPFESEEAALAWAMGEDPDANWNEHRRNGFLGNFRRLDDGSLAGHLPPSAAIQLRRPPGDDAVGRQLPEIRCPTLLLVGTRQAQSRIQDKLEYAAGIPDCTVARLPASHFIHTDLPEQTAAAIAGFLRAATGR